MAMENTEETTRDASRDLSRKLTELLDSKQYTALRQRLEDMQEADIAAVMDSMEDEDSLKMLSLTI